MIEPGTDSSVFIDGVSPRAQKARFNWIGAFHGVFLGSRGILKMSHLWITLSVLFIPHSAIDLRTNLNRSFPLILAVLCRIQFSILLNDVIDKNEDQAVGKRRWIHNVPPPIDFLIAWALFAVGLAAVLLWGGSLDTTLAYAASTFCALAYSQRPFRFKERGKLGLIVYAASAILVYVLVPWMWFRASFWSLLFLTAAVGSDKWIQIHFHEVVDYSADLKTGARTYVVLAGLDRARASLKTASTIASLCLSTAIVYVACIIGSAMATAFLFWVLVSATILSRIYVGRMKRRQTRASDLIRELPWFYLGFSFLFFYILPVVLFIISAMIEPRIWILVAIAFLFMSSTSLQSHRYQYK